MSVATVELRPGYRISRVIRGGWQLAGGHGSIERESAVEDLIAAAEAGIVAFDCADIYTGVEDLYGAFRAAFRRRFGGEALRRLRFHTKYVPDLDSLARLDKRAVTSVIDRSLERLGMERLDLVQFHWWDYGVPGLAQAALWLEDLRRGGKIDLIGATNFDAAHVEEMVSAGVPLASLQVQYSPLDTRPAGRLTEVCRKHGIHLLCYGSVAGGFVGERWIAKPEPQEPLENRSLTKYKLIIDDFGGWALFQELLQALAAIGARRGTDVATVASRWTLDQPLVAAVIVGARNRSHLAANLAVTAFELTDEDRAEIAAVLARRKGPVGEVYELERDRGGRHGSIMKYNLSAVRA